MYKKVPIFRCTTPSTGKRLKEFEVVVGILYKYNVQYNVPTTTSNSFNLFPVDGVVHRNIGTFLYIFSLSLVGKKDKVCCQSWLLDSEWVLQRLPVRDCGHCLACTVGLFLQVRCSWAQGPSPDCCRLLTGDDGLPPSLLLLILLVWQDVACEYTFDSKLGHKIHKEHPIEHHCHKNKHADNRHDCRRRGIGRVFHDRRFS